MKIKTGDGRPDYIAFRVSGGASPTCSLVPPPRHDNEELFVFAAGAGSCLRCLLSCVVSSYLVIPSALVFVGADVEIYPHTLAFLNVETSNSAFCAIEDIEGKKEFVAVLVAFEDV